MEWNCQRNRKLRGHSVIKVLKVMKVKYIYVRLECSLSFHYLIRWWLTLWLYPSFVQDKSEGSECTDKDLLYISSTVQVHVRDVVYELLGEISSDESDTELEHYLIKTNDECSNLQGMAKMKQTARKQEPAAGTSAGGLPLATWSGRGITFDSDSSIERAADALSSDSNMSSRPVRRSSPKETQPDRVHQHGGGRTGGDSNGSNAGGTKEGFNENKKAGWTTNEGTVSQMK